MIEDQPRQAERKARKAAGIPASSEVAVLSTMIQSLRSATGSHLGHDINSAVATTPHLVALYLEDIHDAFEYLHLRHLDLPVRYGLLRETSAAYAGYGHGLCSDYTDQVACKSEQQNMPNDVVMAVLYTTSALMVSLSILSSSYYLWESPERHIEDFGLGSAANCDNSGSTFYWEKIRDRLMEIMVTHQYYEKPRKVLLMGESANDARFQRVLDDVLRSVMHDQPEYYREQMEEVAALGAAEMAKRASWDPYKPLAGPEVWKEPSTDSNQCDNN